MYYGDETIVDVVVLDHKQREKENELRKKLVRCRACKKCKKEEIVKTSKELKFSSNNGVIRIVQENYICSSNELLTDHGEVQPSSFCFHGSPIRDSDDKCSNCKYAIPTIIDFGKNRRGVHKTQIVYLCQNGSRMEHYEKGTAMSAYISCEFHERTDVTYGNEILPQLDNPLLRPI